MPDPWATRLVKDLANRPRLHLEKNFLFFVYFSTIICHCISFLSATAYSNFWDGKFFPGGRTSKEPCYRGRAGKLWKSWLQTIDYCHHLSSEWKPEHFFTTGNYNLPLVLHLIEKAARTVEITTIIIII